MTEYTVYDGKRLRVEHPSLDGSAPTTYDVPERLKEVDPATAPKDTLIGFPEFGHKPHFGQPDSKSCKATVEWSDNPGKHYQCSRPVDKNECCTHHVASYFALIKEQKREEKGAVVTSAMSAREQLRLARIDRKAALQKELLHERAQLRHAHTTEHAALVRDIQRKVDQLWEEYHADVKELRDMLAQQVQSVMTEAKAEVAYLRETAEKEIGTLRSNTQEAVNQLWADRRS